MTTITCYKGSIQAITEYIFEPNSRKIISRKDDGSRVSIEQIPNEPECNLACDMYITLGEPIQIRKKDFDKLYNRCEKIEKIEKEKLNLATKLFKQI